MGSLFVPATWHRLLVPSILTSRRARVQAGRAELNSKLTLANNVWPSGLEKLSMVPAADKSMVPQASIAMGGGVCDQVTTSRVARLTFVRVIDLYCTDI